MAEPLGHSLSCKTAQQELLALLRGNYHLFGHLVTFQRHSGMEILNLIPPQNGLQPRALPKATGRTEPGPDIWNKLHQLCASTAVLL